MEGFEVSHCVCLCTHIHVQCISGVNKLPIRDLFP